MLRSNDRSCQNVVTALSVSAAARDDPSSQVSELNTVRKLGWSVVESNLRLGRYSPAIISDVRALYSRLFNFDSDGTIPLNLRRLIDPADFDLLGRSYEECLHASGTRKSFGEYYSHPKIVRYMVDSLGLESDFGLQGRNFIDIACGTGIFLVAAMKKSIEVLWSRGLTAGEIMETVPGHVFGMDINPVACEIARINMFLTLLNELGPGPLIAAGDLPLNIFADDAIENRAGYSDAATLEIKHRTGKFKAGFDYILGNPPYLEAKRMPMHLKERCKANFPELEGAFDLYMAFISQCNKLVSDRGKVHLILPDKYTVARYARKMRRQMLDRMTLLGITDLSETDVFSRAMVYPVLLYYQNSPPAESHSVPTRISVGDADELACDSSRALVRQSLYREIGGMSTMFCMPPGNSIVDTFGHIFKEGLPLGEYLSFRSTVTFHKKGLREQFVRKNFDCGWKEKLFRYLGGLSYARKNEVELLGFDWQGYHIDYDQQALRHLKNKLPPVDIFTREKIVLCQHARRIVAAYDETGEYVCKDVYPIGIAGQGLESSPFSLKYFAGLLNSELMSFIYNRIYKGVQVSGGYYHYLPTWLEVLPVIAPEKEDICNVESIVTKAIAAKSQEMKARLMAAVDENIYRTYGITGAQQAVIKKTVPAWPGKNIR